MVCTQWTCGLASMKQVQFSAAFDKLVRLAALCTGEEVENRRCGEVAMPVIVPNSEAFNSFIGDFFLVPELKGESDSSKNEQADSLSENNVGNGALFVIGLNGSGDVIAHVLQDWEVAKVALSCHIALDMLCEELHDVERRRGWFGFGARPVFGENGEGSE